MIEWFYKLACNGYSIGQNILRCCYEKGIGTDKDCKKSAEWYLQLAKNIYFLNGIGTDKSFVKAFVN